MEITYIVGLVQCWVGITQVSQYEPLRDFLVIFSLKP
jgi:hypothetical protein